MIVLFAIILILLMYVVSGKKERVCPEGTTQMRCMNPDGSPVCI